MSELKVINSPESFFAFIKRFTIGPSTRLFRGVYSNNFTLLPLIGRVESPSGGTMTPNDESLLFRTFKQRAARFIAPQYNDAEILALAQHHGAPTRLLDWSFNPLVAAYFAVEKDIPPYERAENNIEHSTIYVYEPHHRTFVDDSAFNPFTITSIRMYIPNHHIQRITNQNGLFTVHPHPWTDMLQSDLTIYSQPIALEYRQELRKLLNRLGVNESFIYPEIDGVSRHVRWMRTSETWNT